MSGNTRARWRPFGLALLLAFALAGGAVAQDRGQVTNLPMPRYVSLKAAEGNVRRGPSLTHRIDWVFQRRDMPLRITQVQCYSLEVVTPPEEWPNTEGDGR